MRVENLFEHIPDDLPDELIRTIVDQDSVRVERIVSRGHRSPEDFWYDQPHDEWVVLLQGSAGLVFETEAQPVTLKPGDHLLIPAHARHRVAWTAEQGDTIWLAVHFANALNG